MSLSSPSSARSTSDLIDPDRVNIFERWESQAALERNSKTCGSARATLFFPPAVLLTTLIFATILAVARSWGRIRGGRAPGVQRR
jgi:hypothetical protein